MVRNGHPRGIAKRTLQPVLQAVWCEYWAGGFICGSIAPGSGFAPTSPGAGPGAAETLACGAPTVALPTHCVPDEQQVGQSTGAAFDVAVSGGAAVCMPAVCTAAAGSGLAGGGGECLAVLHGLYRQLGFLYCEQSQTAL